MAKSKTVNVMCSVHEMGVWQGKTKRLQRGIEDAYRTHANPNAKLRFIWAQVPPGQGWLAGYPSTASTLVVPVPDDIAQETRVEMMSAICADWMEVTGCSVNEIIVNAMAESEVARYFEVAQTRFDPARSTALKLKLAWRLISSKLTKGYLTTSINMP